MQFTLLYFICATRSYYSLELMCMTRKRDRHLDFFRETVLFSLCQEVCHAGYTDHYHLVHINW